ncbi:MULTISPECIES: hypothetical protein [Achromobacter]|uniref:Uncharacterized protein n=1 Tax=Achromobacter spanius TaxID=217203 RepID=A0ABY8H076_9BURK|nr:MULTISPECIES: hypothetical protein [Achromobacter]WAI85766.1 hypothetical protein N8Z00_12120 [Achromobacter spanius]WEX95847.1 hypothetical protein N3Z32_06710 [Achromobacter sp. SS2-2022]WFP10432.1 hypothetical protein P8T11_11370 [Achromobacter spanius]
MALRPHVKERVQFLFEATIWVIAPFTWLMYATATGLNKADDWIRSTTVMVPFAYLIAIPVLYALVFGTLPIAHIRAHRRGLRSFQFLAGSEYAENIGMSFNRVAESDEERAANQKHDKAVRKLVHIREHAHLRFLSDLTRQSKIVADNVRTRAGLFLLGGIVIAFSGVGFFYAQTPRTYTGKELSEILATLAPNFGVLFFIEFIALFMFRQYRPLMDEFRHYEAIQRRREEVGALLSLLEEHDVEVNPLELAREGFYFSIGELLENGETTALLETRKLDRDEAVGLWSKVIDALPRMKS